MALSRKWKKSSKSEPGQCVQVRLDETPGTIEIGDTKDPTGPTLKVTDSAFNDFLGAVRRGEFDLH